MRIVSALRPRTAAVLYRRTKAGLSRIFAVGGLEVFAGGSSTVCEGRRRLAETCGAQAILDPCLGHRQPVRFGSTPAISAEPAFKSGAAARTGKPARGRCSCGDHPASLRGADSKRKIVIWRSRISRMAYA